LAKEGVEVGADPQLVHGPAHPGVFEFQSAVADPLVSGQRLIGWQPGPAQDGGPGVFAPQLTPRLISCSGLCCRRFYFQYVNARGGVNGRKIVYKYLNDQYDPTITSTVVHQLVLQNNVYAIFDGLGTPTHLAVVKYLNSSKIPGRVRRLRLRMLERPEHPAVYVRLAAQLHPRGQDPRELPD